MRIISGWSASCASLEDCEAIAVPRPALSAMNAEQHGPVIMSRSAGKIQSPLCCCILCAMSGCQNMTLLQSSHKHKKWEHKTSQKYLRSFLERHGFADAHSPRGLGGKMGVTPGSIRMESIYPIHVAAQFGDVSILRMLLDMGVDPETGAFEGRTAAHFAEQANQDGSHDPVLQLLANRQQVMSEAL
eukprot:s23_g22.t1